MIRRILLVLAVLILACLAQTGQPIPECKGEECTDDSNGNHRGGQPLWCQNHDGGGYVHNCDCQREACDREGTPGGGNMPQCSVYCRKSSCRCTKPCQTQ